MRLELIGLHSIGYGKIRKAFCPGNEPGQAITRADPYISFAIFEDAIDHLIGKPILSAIYSKLLRSPVHEIKPRAGADPDIPVTIFEKRVNGIIAQAVLAGIMPEMSKYFYFFIEPVYPGSSGPDPEISFAVTQQGRDIVAGQAVRICHQMLVPGEAFFTGG